jgi:hypothetical protein
MFAAIAAVAVVLGLLHWLGPALVGFVVLLAIPPAAIVTLARIEEPYQLGWQAVFLVIAVVAVTVGLLGVLVPDMMGIVLIVAIVVSGVFWIGTLLTWFVPRMIQGPEIFLYLAPELID